MNEPYYAYIGPNIRGVIQHNTLYTGSREEVEEQLADQIKKYPKIKSLLVGGSTLAVDREKIKSPGNYLFDVNRKLIAEIKRN